MRVLETIIEFTTDYGSFAFYRLFGENPRNFTNSEAKLLYNSDLDTFNEIDVDISYDFDIIGLVNSLTEEQCRMIIPAIKNQFLNRYNNRSFISAKEAFDDLCFQFEIFTKNPYSNDTSKEYKEIELNIGNWLILKLI